MSAQRQPDENEQKRLDYIIQRLDAAVETVIAFYAPRTDVRLDWNRRSAEQAIAWRNLTEAQNAYGMNILTEAEVKTYFQKWVKTLEVPFQKPKVVLRMMPQGVTA
jgi:hypothetical protein